MRRGFTVVAAALTFAACTRTQEPPRPVASPVPELDLSALSARARLAFHAADDGTQAGGDVEFSSAVDSAGHLSFSGLHALKSSRGGRPVDELVRASPLHLQTARIRRSSEASSIVAPPMVSNIRGRVIIERGVATEEVENLEAGVEQSWHFTVAPPGRGSLIIELSFSGQRLASHTASGHHFVDPLTGVGTCYGQATWIDSKQRKSPVPMTCARDACVLEVPADVVDGSSYPATLDPLISAEFGIDTPVIRPSTGYAAHAAFDGTNYLVVWHTQSAVYGARVTPQGALLDPTGFQIMAGGHFPSVAFGGGTYLVVWSADSGSGAKTMGTRVTPAGAVLDPGGVVIGTRGASNYGPVVAFGPGNFLVAWMEYDAQTYVYDVAAARVSTVATVLDNPPLPLSANGEVGSVAGSSSGFLVVWTDSSSVRAGRIDATGTSLDPGGRILATQRSPTMSVASDGTDYFATWQNSGGSPRVLNGVRFASSGAVGSPFTVASGVQLRMGPATSFNGTDYVVAWENAQSLPTVYAARVSTSGLLRDSNGVPVSSNAYGSDTPGIACSPASCLVLFQNTLGVVGARFSAAGTALDAAAFPVAGVYNVERVPAVAFNGTNFLVAWNDTRSGGWAGNLYGTSVYATRISPSGTTLDDPALQLQGLDTFAAVGSNGTDFLVVTTNAIASRVSAAGTVLDPSGFRIAPAGTNREYFDVAAVGSQYLVVWREPRGIIGTRVTASGAVLDPAGLVISNADGYVAASSDGTNYFVAYSDFSHWTAARRLSASGVLLEDAGISVAGAIGPSVAYDGTNFLVVTCGIGGARVDRNGTVLDPAGFHISPPSTLYSVPPPRLHEAAFDGLSFLVAAQRTNSLDIGIGRATSSGLPVDNRVVATAAEPPPALASDGNRHSLLVYGRTDSSVSGNPIRLYARIIDTSPQSNGVPCGIVGDCMSGLCVDGVCCDSACGGGSAADCMACSVDAGAQSDGVCGAVRVGSACRPKAGPCDVDDACDGVATQCPLDGFADAGELCRPAPGQCDQPEFCTGTAADCPPDAPRDAGSPCNDGNACTGDVCAGFSCVGVPLDAGIVCFGPDQCSTGYSCNGLGACASGGRRACPSDDCHVGSCSYSTGACIDYSRANGWPCDGGTCNWGICTPPDAGLPTSDAGKGVDAGTPDSGATDSGTAIDAGGPDAGAGIDGGDAETDAGDSGSAFDAGPQDGGAGLDSGYEDAGMGIDAGAPDGGGSGDAGRDAGSSGADAGHREDAGSGDGGVAADAGSDGGMGAADAGPGYDAGSVPEAGPQEGGDAGNGDAGVAPPGPPGCGCTSSAGSAWWLCFGFIAVVFTRQRRRARVGRSPQQVELDQSRVLPTTPATVPHSSPTRIRGKHDLHVAK